MSFTDHGAQDSESLYEGSHTIPFFRLSPEAQISFHEWLKQLQEKLEGKEHPIIGQHLSKYRSLMPSLALIFHVVDIAGGHKAQNVTLSAVQKAAAWCAYLDSDMRYLFFSDAAGCEFLVDSLAESRGVASSQLRGPARVDR